MKKLVSVLTFTLLILGANNLIAQKIGHINSAKLLSELPEVKSANSKLEAFQKQKVAKGEQMAKAFQANYIAAMKEVESGTMSPVKQQEKEAALKSEQEAIQKYEFEVQQALAKKREELLSPIINRVNTAISQVGKDNGYDYIFDSSLGVLIYFKESDDVTSLVKQKLGI